MRIREIAMAAVASAVIAHAALPPRQAQGAEAPNSCISCHEDATRMAELGYPHFAVTRAEVKKESGMPASCSECHLGDPAKAGKEEAHRGMGRLLLSKKNGLTAGPVERKLPLEIGGAPVSRLKYFAEKDGKKVADQSVSAILYQDRRRDTLSQDFAMMERTCGACHAREFAEFTRSTMARNAKQSSYRSWTDRERGPHNCGVWSDGNYDKIAANSALPFSPEVNALNQRQCNSCHVGCLDCHYDPQAKDPADPAKGMHTFNRTPRPESCYGGGRGSLCHAGPEDRRRGAGYFGGSYSHPEGMEPDAHAARRVGCLDCHASSRDDKGLGHAMVRRQATCGKCHAATVESHARSRHKMLSCEACHIQQVAGYQATFWGPGKLGGTETPFFKYKDYYGVMAEPVLIRDQGGRWIPVKPYPMAVLNQKQGIDLAPGLHWRWPKGLPDLGRTDDAWGYVGLFDGLPENNRALLWIQMDKMSHKYGKSRSCASCHELPDGEQRQTVSWEFSDVGALPFDGSHTVIAGRNGLLIRGMRAKGPIEASEGQALSSLAPWFYLKDSWGIPGDFSIPPLRDLKGYGAALGDLNKARKAGLLHR
ncbi:MAG TPA: cytochrome c3 family protein [Geobacteraceae bacterium]